MSPLIAQSVGRILVTGEMPSMFREPVSMKSHRRGEMVRGAGTFEQTSAATGAVGCIFGLFITPFARC